MKLVVDANIIVSCLVKFDGRTGELYLNPPEHVEYFAPEHLLAELSLHRHRIQKAAGATADRYAEMEELLLSDLVIVPASRVASVHWEHAYDLVKDIDEDDVQFVALALHLNCPLWTGDKKLVSGLRRKNFKLLITSEELRKQLGV